MHSFLKIWLLGKEKSPSSKAAKNHCYANNAYKKLLPTLSSWMANRMIAHTCAQAYRVGCENTYSKVRAGLKENSVPLVTWIIILCFFSTVWRVQVVETPAKDEENVCEVTIKYIDEGRTSQVNSDELLHLPAKFQSLPPQAVEIIVCRVKPIDNEVEWNPKVISSICMAFPLCSLPSLSFSARKQLQTVNLGTRFHGLLVLTLNSYYWARFSEGQFSFFFFLWNNTVNFMRSFFSDLNVFLLE